MRQKIIDKILQHEDTKQIGQRMQKIARQYRLVNIYHNPYMFGGNWALAGAIVPKAAYLAFKNQR